MKIQEGLLYHKEHEWVKVVGTRATLGISDFAQDALGDIVYLELPKVGTVVQAGAELTEIESTKTTSPMYAPVAGTIVEVNAQLHEKPDLINKKPYTEGWIVVIEMSQPKDLTHLMTADAYDLFLKREAL
jgi:glycine cleavage system H protein